MKMVKAIFNISRLHKNGYVRSLKCDLYYSLLITLNSFSTIKSYPFSRSFSKGWGSSFKGRF